MIKAISLLSGGLDSAIATQIMKDQGVEVFGLNFQSPFCTCNPKSGGCPAINFAQKLEIPINIMMKGNDYLEIVKNPKFGYGKNLNPCIDCRIYILKKAKEYADEIGADFIITGEVLGQRPKSQTLNSLKIIDDESGLKGFIVRPLSAKLLPPTVPEKKGWISRNALFQIQGRRRNLQIEMGKNYGLIKSYCSGGGCLLTDPHFARKLKDYFEHTDVPRMEDMPFLKIGRHYRYNGVKIISGRDERENNLMTNLCNGRDVLIEIKNVKGPRTLLIEPMSRMELNFAAQVTIRYSNSVDKVNHMEILKGNDLFHDFIAIRESNPNLASYKI